MNTNINVKTEEYYIASIDLLGVKEIINADDKDEKLNQIKAIYGSWPPILRDRYFQDMKIRFFSDNVVIALDANKPGAADKLLETIAWVCNHFLRCGYKPRGGICKGRFYIDDIFVWGAGLVQAYLIESKEAIYPRIVLSDEVVDAASEHVLEWLLFRDSDNKVCLNYLKAFGGSKKGWLEDINGILKWLVPEYEESEKRIQNAQYSSEDKKIYEKLKWLIKFVKDNKEFWENRGC